MELSGHTGEVFAARFDPAGHLIASGSMDRTISKVDPFASGRQLIVLRPMANIR